MTLDEKQDDGITDALKDLTHGKCSIEENIRLAHKLQVMSGFGVGTVLDSGNPDFKVGDLVLGTTGWEQYSLITSAEELLKIKHTDVPLSYYIGLLGKQEVKLEAVNLLLHSNAFIQLPQLESPFLPPTAKENKLTRRGCSRASESSD